ncbi:NUDIX domain-containing protein [Pseudomonas oryzihabitans]|uniref:8-oxo-dGTP pyrophosphatase MutT (NUDIX family) n=1 Tax=Pseudomonas oryzihabitans TaxID=47885 RepID=A0AAJ2BTW0_9PSED|nr:NUDIX domain-containing protein [Pseudomonas psychrotolerans]MDR6236317.1 8-oxo-dGTP pyrophosphatase MutT (NUDIX family) [Pseudomonas psychrotolerans]MDR6354328.1 8-oxo-dGTP pyrophosphatase MutT (NUDIX family) [Pseudomonas psychrotolerans]
MQYRQDAFNGLIIDAASLPSSREAFAPLLAELLDQARREGRNLIWLTLPLALGELVGVATAAGFVFHNCLEQELTLVWRGAPSAFAPFVPTHSLGVGGLVLNERGELLAIRERGSQGYKLPGGHVELGEDLAPAVIREVWEETGIHSAFRAIVGMVTTHPYRFGKSNLYLVCRLDPLSADIAIQDPEEIEDALWLALPDYLADAGNSAFNRELVHSLARSEGLVPSALNSERYPKAEVFLAQSSKD